MCSEASIRTLVIGYVDTIIKEFRKVLDVQFVISQSSEADLNWNEFHQLNGPLKFDNQKNNKYEIIRLNQIFEKYLDITSRRYEVIHAHHSETKNMLIIYYYIIKGIFEKYQIQQVLFENIPHEGFDFIVYTLAKYYKLRTIITNQTQFSDRFWIIEEVEDFGRFSIEPFSKYENINIELPENWFYVQNIKRSDYFYRLRDFLTDTCKDPKKLPVFAIKYHLSRQYAANLLSASKCEIDTGTDEYIYFPLHMQPEMNVTSMGGFAGLYSDQVLILETIRSIIPEHVKIVLKENPKQTYKSRDQYFFERLKNLENTYFVSDESNSRELIAGSIGVVTLAGTAGWEALLLGKPCLTFGNAWYNSLPGVEIFNDNFSYAKWIETSPVSHNIINDELNKLMQKCGFGVVDTDYIKIARNFNDYSNARSVARSIKDYLNANIA